MVVKRIILFSLLAVIVVGGSWFSWIIWITGHELYAHLRIIDDVDEQLGFHYSTPYENGKEVFVITAVEPEKPMEKAGIKVGDYPQCTISSLYERIVFGQGKQIIIPIRRGAEEIEIKLVVPRLTLRNDPSKLHWPFVKHKE